MLNRRVPICAARMEFRDKSLYHGVRGLGVVARRSRGLLSAVGNRRYGARVRRAEVLDESTRDGGIAPLRYGLR